jgi:prepilin-type N-terminal cleavage/methylation domain-containing protein
VAYPNRASIIVRPCDRPRLIHVVLLLHLKGAASLTVGLKSWRLPLGIQAKKVEEFMSHFTRSVRDNGEAGFTLIELAAVVLIVTIMMTLSMIFFGRASAHYKLNQKAQDFASQIERARSLAIKYNQTLTVGFTSQNKVMGLTCTDCVDAKSELPPYTIPSDLSLSAYPTLTIKGNGTISATNASVTINDNKGRQVTVNVSNSGRIIVGEIRDAYATS